PVNCLFHEGARRAVAHPVPPPVHQARRRLHPSVSRRRLHYAAYGVDARGAGSRVRRPARADRQIARLLGPAPVEPELGPSARQGLRTLRRTDWTVREPSGAGARLADRLVATYQREGARCEVRHLARPDLVAAPRRRGLASL